MNSLRFYRNRSVRFCRPRPVCSAGPSGVFSVEGPRPTRRSTERSVVPIRGGFVRMGVAESGFRSSKAGCRPTTDPILCESVGLRRAFLCRRSIVLRRNRFLSAGRNSPPIRTFFRAGTACRFVSLCGVAFHRSAERGICGLGSVFSNVPAGCRVGGAVAFLHRNRLPFPVCAGKGGLLPLHGKSSCGSGFVSVLDSAFALNNRGIRRCFLFPRRMIWFSSLFRRGRCVRFRCAESALHSPTNRVGRNLRRCTVFDGIRSGRRYPLASVRLSGSGRSLSPLFVNRGGMPFGMERASVSGRQRGNYSSASAFSRRMPRDPLTRTVRSRTG